MVGLAKLVSLAKWTKENAITVDFTWLIAQEIVRAETPLTTPAITVAGQKQEGNQIQTVTLYGGVDLRVQNKYVPEGQQEIAARGIALNSRISDAVQTWTFQTENKSRVAVAIGLSPVSKIGGYRATVQDLKVADKPPLALSRQYNSLGTEPGAFGSG